MTIENESLSTFVWKLTTSGCHTFGETLDDFFHANNTYVTWKDRIRHIQILHADNRSKIHQLIKQFGLLAPTALVGLALYKNPLIFVVAAGVATWATQKHNMFSTLKHSVVRTAEDGFTAAILIGPTHSFLKSQAFYALIGFVTGYALSHFAIDKSANASENQPPSDQKRLGSMESDSKAHSAKALSESSSNSNGQDREWQNLAPSLAK